MKTHIVLIFAVGIGLMFGPHALGQPAQTTPCPPGTTPSMSNTKNTANKNAPKQHQGGRNTHSQSHAGVGVGVNVDLSGVGQRKAEADPFAVPGPQAERKSSTARTNSTERTSRSHAGSHRQSSDDALWSQVNPITKP